MIDVIENTAQQVLQAAPAGALQAIPQQQVAVLDPGALLQIAVQRGDSIEVLTKLMDLKDRFDATMARNAFNVAFARFKAENVQVLVTTVSDFQIIALIEALKKIDYTKITILGADTIKTTDMLKGTGVVKGLYATSPVLDAREFTAGAAFLDKYRAKFKKWQTIIGADWPVLTITAATMEAFKLRRLQEQAGAITGLREQVPFVVTPEGCDGPTEAGVALVNAALDLP